MSTPPLVLSCLELDEAHVAEIVRKINASARPVELSFSFHPLYDERQSDAANEAIIAIMSNASTKAKVVKLDANGHLHYFSHPAAQALADFVRGSTVLKTLVLNNCMFGQWSDDVFNALETNTSLTDLTLQYMLLDSKSLNSLARTLLRPDTAITTLTLSLNPGSSIDTSRLTYAMATNTTLKHFKFYNYNNMSNSDYYIAFIGEVLRLNPTTMESLELYVSLELSPNEPSYRHMAVYNLLEAIKSHKKLHTLVLNASLNRAEWLYELGDVLSGTKTLRKFKLWSGDLRAYNVAALIDGLKRNSTLEELNLSSIDFPPHFYTSFASEVLNKANPTLKTLVFSQCRTMDKEGTSAIFTALANDTNPLETLALRDDRRMYTWCVPAIENLLRRNKHLVEMDLSRNAYPQNLYDPSITDDEIEAGMTNAFALGTNTTLRRLYLEQCWMPPRIGFAFGEMLKYNKALQKLSLTGSCFSSGVFGAFADALVQNTTLKELGLDMTTYDNEGRGIPALAYVLKHNNRTLKGLDFGRTPLQSNERSALIDVFSENDVLEKITIHTGHQAELDDAVTHRNMRLARDAAFTLDLPPMPDNVRRTMMEFAFESPATFERIQRDTKHKREKNELARAMGERGDNNVDDDARVCSIF